MESPEHPRRTKKRWPKLEAKTPRRWGYLGICFFDLYDVLCVVTCSNPEEKAEKLIDFPLTIGFDSGFL